MRFATTFALATALVAVAAAPAPGRHGKHSKWDNYKHGSDGSWSQDKGHKHVQPVADAPATTDEWDEVEDCSPEDVAATPTDNDQFNAQPGVESAASSSQSPSASPSADDWWQGGDKQGQRKQDGQNQHQQDGQDQGKQDGQDQGKQDGQDKGKQDSGPKDTQPQQDGQQGQQGGGGNVDSSGGGRKGKTTTYSVVDPAQNGGNAAGKVACQSGTRKQLYNDDDLIAAVPEGMLNEGMCGKMVKIKGDKGEVEVEIVDACGDGAHCYEFDLSPAAMIQIHGVADDVVDIEYWGL